MRTHVKARRYEAGSKQSAICDMRTRRGLLSPLTSMRTRRGLASPLTSFLVLISHSQRYALTHTNTHTHTGAHTHAHTRRDGDGHTDTMLKK